MTTNTTIPPSIATTKQSFLSQQARLLSAPFTLPPSSSTTTSSSDKPTPQLPTKTLTDLLARTNAKLTSHNRAIFSAQAQTHIAAQIETLYWNEIIAERETQVNTDGVVGAETVVRRDVDLCGSSGAPALETSLPERWEDVIVSHDHDLDYDDEQAQAQAHAQAHDTSEDTTPDAQAYALLRTHLLALASQKAGLQQKLQRYKRLEQLLEPYESPQTEIQPNLVTRDGELVREMERMRGLLARVTARMGTYHDHDQGQGRERVVGHGGEQGMGQGERALGERVDLLMAVD